MFTFVTEAGNLQISEVGTLNKKIYSIIVAAKHTNTKIYK